MSAESSASGLDVWYDPKVDQPTKMLRKLKDESLNDFLFLFFFLLVRIEMTSISRIFYFLHGQ